MVKMANIKTYLGDFENQSGKVTIGDPCYNKDAECTINKVVAQQGMWNAYILTDIKTMKRQSLFVHHKDYPVKSNAVMGHLFRRAMVDSGQLCVHDSRHWGKKAAVPKGFMSDVVLKFECDDPWYEMHCKITLYTEDHAGVTPFGAVSATTYGDGSYFVSAMKKNGKLVALRVYLV
jgi:hypothetical protein